MKALVISPERVVFDGEVSSVVAPAFDGEVGILPRHAPMVTLLGRGILRLGPVGAGGMGAEVGGGVGERPGTRRFSITGGFLQVAGDVVRLVTESAEPHGETSSPAASSKKTASH
jgi:F-type H+-transporting ATPase subunit epsilon